MAQMTVHARPTALRRYLFTASWGRRQCRHQILRLRPTGGHDRGIAHTGHRDSKAQAGLRGQRRGVRAGALCKPCRVGPFLSRAVAEKVDSMGSGDGPQALGGKKAPGSIRLPTLPRLAGSSPTASADGLGVLLGSSYTFSHRLLTLDRE